MPLSLANWDGLVRTSRGVYELRVNLAESLKLAPQNPIAYRYYPDSPPNEYIAAARKLLEVRTYLWFARSPVFRWHRDGSTVVVEIADLRFFQRSGHPGPFTYRVVFDENKIVVQQGWWKK